VIVSDLRRSELARRLRSGELLLQTGPFVSRIQSSIDLVRTGIETLYGQFPVLEESPFADFHVALTRPNSLRRWVRPQVSFLFDHWPPFKPLPLDQAFAMFEWGMNWCVVNYAHNYLILHAAVVEKNGHALIMPAPPASGKSTLCAALASSGWRLLSDELTIFSLGDGSVVPLPRPVGLKNESIQVVRSHFPDATIGRSSHDTSKGTVAHMAPPVSSVRLQRQNAMPAWILFPKYTAVHPLELSTTTKTATLMRLIENAFNYTVLGKVAFECLCRVVDCSECYTLEYSDLDNAICKINELAITRS
jgi:HprK-related kinase A